LNKRIADGQPECKEDAGEAGGKVSGLVCVWCMFDSMGVKY